jgi:predicted SAM-dependent methyltransferase
MTTRRLLIGSTDPAPGWETFDALAEPGVDHVGDAKDLSRFPDNTFAEVYASHVLEHFGYVEDLAKALREWRRVLEPRGVLYVSVPDLDVLAELFLLRESLTAADRFWIMRIMFGGQVTPYDFHHVGLNEEFLSMFFKEAGFAEWARVERLGVFLDTSEYEFKGWRISLNMMARKAG